MTRIISFTIEGLAGRTDSVEHGLNDDINVFWGPNGNGKTTMLKILHSALTNNTEIIRSSAFTSANVQFFSEDHQRTYIRSVTKDQVDKSGPVHERVWDEDLEEFVVVDSRSPNRAPRWVTSTTDSGKNLRTNKQTRFEHSWLPITRMSEGVIRRSPRYASSGVLPGSRPALAESDIDRIFAEGISERWREWEYDSTTSIRQAQDVALAELLEVALRGEVVGDSSEKSLDTKDAYEVVKSFFGERNQTVQFRGFKNFTEFKSKYNKNQVLRDIVHRLDRVENLISQIQAPQRRLEELITELFSRGRKIDFDEEISVLVGGKRIPIGYLSSGERQLMLILLECLRSKTSTIMIDEPELSMHVAWQNRLIASMRRINPRPQLIMATHSPEIMAELEDRCVIEL